MSLMIFISFTYEFVKQIFLFVHFFVCFRSTFYSRRSSHCFMNGKFWMRARYFIKRSKFGIEKGNKECKRHSSYCSFFSSLLTNFELVAKFSFSFAFHRFVSPIVSQVWCWALILLRILALADSPTKLCAWPLLDH